MQILQSANLPIGLAFHRHADRLRSRQGCSVEHLMLFSTRANRRRVENGRAPSVVLIISDASSFLIKSTMCGRPSATLLTERTSKPASFNALAVPLVAASVKPESTSRLATSIAAGLSASLTLNNASPDVGVTSPAPTVPWQMRRQRWGLFP